MAGEKRMPHGAKPEGRKRQRPPDTSDDEALGRPSTPITQMWFQGRPVVPLFWQGRRVLVVKGLWAYREPVDRDEVGQEVERGFSTSKDAKRAALRDRVLGIGVLSLPDDPVDRGASVVDANVPEEVRARLRPLAEWIEPVMLDQGCAFPDDPLVPQQWALDRIKARSRWDLWNGDASRVLLAVLDSGIAMRDGKLSHPDLIEDRFRKGPDLVGHGTDPVDEHGHGTHVTGIAAATAGNGQGLAGLWPGPVMMIKVLNGQLIGASTTFKDGVLAAVRKSRELNLRLVINYSAGGPMGNAKRDAVAHAESEGALVVAAVGNGSGGPVEWPAAYAAEFSSVIAVGAVDQKDKRPEFGSRGPEMSVVAPGVDILSTLPDYDVTLPTPIATRGYGRLSGTSQAAPMVSALAALVWSKSPDLSAAQVRDQILKTSDELEGSEEDFGRGIINFERALT